jgi:hypothetical protein
MISISQPIQYWRRMKKKKAIRKIKGPKTKKQTYQV